MEEAAKKVSVKGKWLKIGAAAMAGSLIVFAAPVLLPAAGALLQTLSGMAAVIGGGTVITTALVSALSATSTFLASSAGLTVFSAGLLAGGAGYAGNKMKRRLSSEVDATIVDVNDLKESQDTVECDTYDVIFINGFLSCNETTIQCWGMKNSFDGGHCYLVDWESELLTNLSTLFMDTAVRASMIQSLSHSLLSRYINALLLRGTFVFSGTLFVLYPISFLDNTWSVIRQKAEVLGTVIADQFLESKENRPMSLVATGCIVIISILKRLVEKRRIGLIQDVVLLGCPASTDKELWMSLRQVVSGRLVNGYSKNDGILCYLHRIESGVISVAGLKEIEVDGVENVNVSHLVKSHFDYKKELRSILQYIRYNSN
ncbi:hypothetical protein JH06_1589 [Blastocystis sp. subtype 4]|uniref:hypothetical protein n=1 Tax=Blastocystis sp. subtype 4 TaxID=944170 RepID=UPI0007113C3C|nr:hypothetical protein JH06_1589 [Blastocystis sp. subtype 4]KNB44867.1 hypothetical protein JH06_1589 [Blastocystis sp. subtype 4]|eukprot:XP_014528310.1 hypothetical protein JH06_1589 [Blastocystis sp. subtype 4]